MTKQSREPLAALSFNIIEENPYGVGLNNYGEVMFGNRYVPPSLVGSSSIYVVHNKYLLVLTETGPWGLAAFILILLGGFATTIHLYFKPRGPAYLLLLSVSLFAAFVGYAQNMSTEPFGTRMRAELLWILVALLAGVYNLAVSQAQQKIEVKQTLGYPEESTSNYGTLI